MKQLALLFALIGLLAAHDLSHRVAEAPAVTVTITYPDGEPFSFEPFTIYTPDSDQPFQKGVTSERGTLAFVPDRIGTWRIRAAAADGHGVMITHTVASLNETQPETAVLNHWERLGIGLALLFGLFGLASLYIAKRKSL